VPGTDLLIYQLKVPCSELDPEVLRVPRIQVLSPAASRTQATPPPFSLHSHLHLPSADRQIGAWHFFVAAIPIFECSRTSHAH